MNDETKSAATPPYVSYRTFSNFIASLREAGIPNRIDRSVPALSGQSGATQSFLLAALRFLAFTTSDGTPTPALREYVDRPANEKAILSKAIRDNYAFIFDGAFNAQAATEAELAEKFKDKQLSGQTVRKAISFFTSLCEAAGIKLSPHLPSKRGAGGNGSLPRRYKRRRLVSAEGGPAVPEQPPFGPNDGSEVFYLYLDKDKKRKVTLRAPFPISEAEADRITNWIKATLIMNTDLATVKT